MLKYVVIEFRGPFRVGRYSLFDSWDYVPSDVIYGALAYLRHVGVAHGVEFVSSAYPVVAGRLTAPLPVSARIRLVKEGRGDKTLKRLRFVPVECLQGKLALEGGKIKCGDDKFDVETLIYFGRHVSIHRNRLSRHLQNADVYKVTAFMPFVNYVIYYVGDGDVFDVLGEVGLGGERSIGLGKFRVVERGEVKGFSHAPESCSRLVVWGVARPREVSARGDWAVRHWWCGGSKLAPVSVLLDGGEVSGGPMFEDVALANCEKRLTPLWVCV